ncbi:MAG TPA: S26 family signal peptidase [Frankiaceae bacterium]|jgi:type IV secretory pathway protease TraF|nr:S26 family signal peptidase [Frankiaceae bacterium]
MKRLRAAAVAAGTALLALAAVRRSWSVAVVTGASMEPTLRDGQCVVVRRRATPRTGDVVVFAVGPEHAPPAHRVKRVMAVAGEPVPPWLREAAPYDVLPPGTLAVAGDNSGRSEDSRQLGLVPLDRVVGVVVR